MHIHLLIDLRAVLIGITLLLVAAGIATPFAISLADDGERVSTAGAPAAALGNAFTYQGRLEQDGVPANGTYDFRFTLFNDPVLPGAIGTFTQTRVVTNGLFTAEIDFGPGAFDGNARWLQAEAKEGANPFVALAPRSTLTPTPYALYALSGGTPYTALPGGGLSLNVNAFSADTSYLQRRVTPGCAPNSSIRTIGADGSVECETDDTSVTNPAWNLTGNAGTSAANFLGTTDSTPLELRVNGQRALQITPGSTPNMVGGHFQNTFNAGLIGVTIGGGGTATGGSLCAGINRVRDSFGTVGGGCDNRAGEGGTGSARFATVGGGNSNVAHGLNATVGGGVDNDAQGNNATVGGGVDNRALHIASTVGGGNNNDALGAASIVGGGDSNVAQGNNATVGGGASNAASEDYATVGGGYSNFAGGLYNTIGGGNNNSTGLQGSTVPGGENNNASAYWSFAAGTNANAVHTGAFVWSDAQGFAFSSTVANSFNVRASGGAFFKGSVDVVGGAHGVKSTGTDNGLWGVGNGAGDGYSRGVAGTGSGTNGNLSAGIFGENPSGGYAGWFQGSVNVTGTLFAGVYGASDARLKTRIEPSGYGLAAVEALRPVSYAMKNGDGSTEIGLIAQEVAAIVPEVVRTMPDQEGMLAVNYSGLIPVLIKAIQEQQEQITALGGGGGSSVAQAGSGATPWAPLAIAFALGALSMAVAYNANARRMTTRSQ